MAVVAQLLAACSDRCFPLQLIPTNQPSQPDYLATLSETKQIDFALVTGSRASSFTFVRAKVLSTTVRAAWGDSSWVYVSKCGGYLFIHAHIDFTVSMAISINVYNVLFSILFVSIYPPIGLRHTTHINWIFPYRIAVFPSIIQHIWVKA